MRICSRQLSTCFEYFCRGLRCRQVPDGPPETAFPRAQMNFELTEGVNVRCAEQWAAAFLPRTGWSVRERKAYFLGLPCSYPLLLCVDRHSAPCFRRHARPMRDVLDGSRRSSRRGGSGGSAACTHFQLAFRQDGVCTLTFATWKQPSICMARSTGTLRSDIGSTGQKSGGRLCRREFFKNNSQTN